MPVYRMYSQRTHLFLVSAKENFYELGSNTTATTRWRTGSGSETRPIFRVWQSTESLWRAIRILWTAIPGIWVLSLTLTLSAIWLWPLCWIPTHKSSPLLKLGISAFSDYTFGIPACFMLVHQLNI